MVNRARNTVPSFAHMEKALSARPREWERRGNGNGGWAMFPELVGVVAFPQLAQLPKVLRTGQARLSILSRAFRQWSG